MSVCLHLLVLVWKLFLQSSDHGFLLLPARFLALIFFSTRNLLVAQNEKGKFKVQRERSLS